VGTVVVLVTDGARIDETFGDLESSVSGEATEEFWPTIREQLLPQGALFFPGYTTGVTITAEGHASMLTGARIPQANFPSDEGPGMYRPELPTHFEGVRGDGSGQSAAALVVNTVHLGGHTWSLMPGQGEELGGTFTFLTQGEDSDQPLGEDSGVIEGVQAHLDANDDTRFVIANLHQMDRSGHFNDNPLAYTGNVKQVDEPIVAFWDWLQADERYADDTVLVVVADHGRHRWQDDATDYQNHGDQCVGCRQIPMFMVGPGLRKDAVILEPYNLEDLGHTIGWLLGHDMPWADGQLMCEALVNPPLANGRTGYWEPSIDGGLEAWQSLGALPSAKSAVVANDEQLSNREAVHAEAPVAWTDGEREVVCFRELHIQSEATFDTIDDWEWQGRCLSRASASAAWEDIAFPDDSVSPYWHPALATAADGALMVAYADNPTGNWEAVDQDLRLLRWTPADGWTGADQGVSTIAHPLDPSLALIGDEAYVAVATSADPTDDPDAKKAGRFTRQVAVWQVSGTENQTWTELLRPATSTEEASAPYSRMERPVLLARGGQLNLAWVAYDTDGASRIAWSRGTEDEEGGWAWTEPEELDKSGLVVGFQRPVWHEGGTLAWARLSEGRVVICTSTDGDAPVCQDTTATAVRGLAWAGASELVAALRDASGTWRLTTVTVD